MAGAKWEAVLIATLLGAGAVFGQAPDAAIPAANGSVITVRQPGMADQTCRVLTSRREANGANSYEVVNMTTGEHMRITEGAMTPGGAASSASPGLRGWASRMLHRDRPIPVMNEAPAMAKASATPMNVPAPTAAASDPAAIAPSDWALTPKVAERKPDFAPALVKSAAADDWRQSWGKADDHQSPAEAVVRLPHAETGHVDPLKDPAYETPRVIDEKYSPHQAAAVARRNSNGAAAPTAAPSSWFDSLQKKLGKEHEPTAVPTERAEWDGVTAAPPPIAANAFGRPTRAALQDSTQTTTARYGSDPNAVPRATLGNGISQPLSEVGGPYSGAMPDCQHLVAILQTGPYPSQRERAAEALAAAGWHANPAIIPALLQGARGDPAPTVRASCVRCLTRMNAGTPTVLTTLEHLRVDSDPQVRTEVNAALRALTPNAENALPVRPN